MELNLSSVTFKDPIWPFCFVLFSMRYFFPYMLTYKY